MSKVIIGTAGGKAIGFDLDLLLPERLLITADSGGGKSYVIRKLLEQLFGKVQSIVIDPEGEFASLREKFPMKLRPMRVATRPVVPRPANGKTTFLGRFSTRKQAGDAYDAAALKFFGEFAATNEELRP